MTLAWSDPVVQHQLWDGGAWLLAVGLFAHTYQRHRPVFAASRLRAVGSGYFLALSLGGLAGAYVVGSANLWLADTPGFARSILGGLVGAIASVEGYKAHQRLRGSTGGVLAPALALGIAVGRLGCHRAGLLDYTYGSPTTLPWAVMTTDGVARHPVALYESATMTVLFVALWHALRRHPRWLLERGFHVFCLVYGAQRFAWEFCKPYPAVLGPLNLFHVLSAGLVIYAAAMLRNPVDG